MLIDKKDVDKIFDESTHQSDVCIALYKLVFKNWDNIIKIEGWPTIGKKGGEYIMSKCIDFDSKHHKKVLKGGLWMNKGFSTLSSEDLDDWEVDLSSCQIIEKGVVIHNEKHENQS